MRLTVVGCSGSMPGPDSPASSYLLEGEETSLVLDLGSGAFGPLQRHVAPHELSAVVLSHLHPDHCADLTAMAVWLRYGPGVGHAPMRVVGPEGTERTIALLTSMIPPEIANTFEVVTLRAGEPVEVGEFTLVPHLAEHPVPAFGFRIVDRAGRALGYTGDTDACEGADAVAADVDLLLAEAAFPDSEPLRGVHLTGSRAGELAQRGGARRLVLTHLQPWQDPGAILGAAAAQFSGPVELARDSETYEIAGREGEGGT